MNIPIYVYIILFVELFIVAVVDLRTKKIKNYWSLINFIIYISNIIFLREIYHFSWESFFFPLVFLLVGFSLYVLNIMGPGDSKFLSSFFLTIPSQLHEYVFLCLGYFTLLIGLVLLIWNIVRNLEKITLAFRLQDVKLIKGVFGKKFSYAPVIFLSWVWFGLTHFKILEI